MTKAVFATKHTKNTKVGVTRAGDQLVRELAQSRFAPLTAQHENTGPPGVLGGEILRFDGP
jgi:hypothetical protein